MEKTILGEIDAYCYMVKAGKPCAMIPIQKRYIYEARKHIKNTYCLEVYIEMISDEWVSLWIYKDKFMLEVINSLPEKPKSIYDHWVLGKAFGYSDEAIKEFLDTKFF